MSSDAESPERRTFPAGLTPGPWGYPIVKGRCPSCGSSSLFLASGGHITCAVIGCKNPTLAGDWLHEGRPLEKALRDVAEIALDRDGVYGDPILAITDRLAGEFVDESLGAELAASGWNR